MNGAQQETAVTVPVRQIDNLLTIKPTLWKQRERGRVTGAIGAPLFVTDVLCGQNVRNKNQGRSATTNLQLNEFTV